MPPSASPNPCAEEILRAAKSLFAERGFDAVSISAIAERAACSKSNIFHHFGSKEELYFDVMRQATQRSVAQIREVMADDKDPYTRLVETVKEHYAVIVEDPEQSRLMMREVMFSSPQRGQALASEVFGEQFVALTDLVKGLTANESVDKSHPAHAEFLAFMLIAANVMRFHCLNVLEYLPGADFAKDSAGYTELLSRMLLQSLNNPVSEAN